MVMLEAVFSGTPIVAFAVGGLPEYLSERTAWLAPPGDPLALAGCLRSALDAADERHRRAGAARSALEHRLGLPAWVAGVEDVYAAVANG
jgi:glycosyltransferase involved in cell wall biosynthesis